MKKTRLLTLYPLNRGLDRSSIPGTQDPKSLRIAKNIISASRPSLKKRPGQRRIPYTGNDDGVQAVTQFFATVGSGQASEVVRVRKGKVEALRDLSGANPQFVDLGLTVSDTDTVTFERFGNALILHFENTRPYYYTIGGTLTPLEILSSHVSTPPTFSRRMDFHLFYAGRRASPHTLYQSAPNDINDYSLLNGGGSYRINDGDGDPVGITALSPPFKGSMWIFKWNQLYQFSRSGYGYGWQEISDETGAIHHNAVCASKTDVYSVDTTGIHSLVLTINLGGSEETALTKDIYEYFQQSVNWSAYKNMVLVYDKPTSNILLSYCKSGSAVNNAVLAMNTFTKQFTEWEGVEYPSICKYFEFGRQRTLVADTERGLCILDNTMNTLDGDPIPVELETGLVFPMQNPKIEVNFTQAWLVCRPTIESSSVDIYYSINGKQEVMETVDMIGKGYGSEIDDTLDEGGELIGSDIIGQMDGDLATIPFQFQGEGSSVRFRLVHEPTATDADKEFEIYGILAEYDYQEDVEQKRSA